MGRTFTETLTEGQTAAVATTGPTILNGTSVSTGAINMGTGPRRVRAFFSFGSVNASSLLTLGIRASATLAGSYTAITNNTTNPTLTGVLGVAGQLVSLEIRADQLPSGYSFVKGYALETGNNVVTVDILLIGDCSDQSPGNQFDNVTWINRVTTTT